MGTNNLLRHLLLVALLTGFSTTALAKKKSKSEEKEEASTETSSDEPAFDDELEEEEEEGMGITLALQSRIEMLNVLNVEGSTINSALGQSSGGFDQPFVPFVSMGVRMLDDKLYAGLGFGFAGADDTFAGFTLSPLVTFDFLSNEHGAVYAISWFHIGHFDRSFIFIDPNTGDSFGFKEDFTTGGLSVGAGIRGQISESISLGTEWGWGFVAHDVDEAPGDFLHGIWGNLTFEVAYAL